MTETNTPAPTVDLDELTNLAKSQFANVNKIKATAKAFAEAADKAEAAAVIALGTTLSRIKAALPYGGWYPWLAENFAGSKSTATRFIQCAELANRATLHDFGYSQLTLLLPLASDELPAFLAAMTANGTNPAELSVRDLREAIKGWRKSKSLPAPVTIDNAGTVEPMDEVNASAVTLTFDTPDTTPATIFSTAPTPPTTPVTFTPAPPLPLKYIQQSLFDLPALPALPPRYELPTLVTEAAAKIDTPVYVVPRPTKAEFPAPSILLVLATLSASWTQRLIAKATAFIMTKIPVQRSDGRTARKSVLIIYNGDNSDAFSNAFRYFGLTFFTNQKSSAATNSEALL